MRYIALTTAFAAGLVVQSSHSWGAVAPRCPADAMIISPVRNPEIVWQRVRSEKQAEACLHDVAYRLGPEATLLWFKNSGFRGVALYNDRRIYRTPKESLRVNAAWSVSEDGILYSDGLWGTLLKIRLAHAISFDVSWIGSEVEVQIGYVYE